jgi:hypothetical protein
MCAQSLPCLIDAVWKYVAVPADNSTVPAAAAAAAAGGSAARMLQALSSCCSLQHLAGVVIPGLLLYYNELRARRAWLAMQQQARSQQQRLNASPDQQTPSQTANTAATAHASASAAAAGSASREAMAKGTTDDLTALSPQQLQPPQQPDVLAAADSSTTTSNQLQQPQVSGIERQAARATDSPAAAGVGPVASPLTAAAQRRLASCKMLYSSPLKSKVVAFKLRHPPTADGAGTCCAWHQQVCRILCFSS